MIQLFNATDNLHEFMGKIDNEKQTVDRMVRLYCRKKHHSTVDLCRECQAVRNYALDRLTLCPFKEDKTACKDCKVHCYKNDMRTEIRKVMRFSGPRMMVCYPLDFIKHIIR